MIKKGLFKKLVALSMVGIMSLAFVGCGDTESDKDDKEIEVEEETEEETEEDTEAVEEDTEAEEEVVEEDVEEATEAEEAESGFEFDDATGAMSFNGATATVPAGYTYSEADSAASAATFMYQSEDMSVVNALVVGIDNANTVTDVETAVSMFDSQIKSVYGDQCTSSDVTYNGNAVTEWVIDDPSGGYQGRSAVICDGNMLIYVEYVSVGGDVADYEAFMNTLAY